ncbi:hypothetical protein DPMN_013451 [Dreissena polymorpha]|uniref:Uncharacterized protein n=1 Tax=Dreissena polymorpha TaxID=45954 RepID=A0A9D4S4C1_DREPO|nr:hypothetical protein DPMN_013451 [Dreissena polymorpha]
MPAVKRQKRPAKRVLKDCLLNLLCTPQRNRLGEATLKSLIRLCLHMKRLGEEEVTRIIDKFTEKPRNVDL